MKTWIEKFLENINNEDLSLPCPTIKCIDKNETVIGELSEYLQKLYRFQERQKQNAEELRETINDYRGLYTEGFEAGDMTEEEGQVYIEKIGDSFDVFKAVFMPCITIDHLFINEVENAFPDLSAQFPVFGIRDGKTLIGRDDNQRNDQSDLYDFFIEMTIVLESLGLMKKFS